MTVETAQILSTVIRNYISAESDDENFDVDTLDDLYQVTHPNHPATLWASTSLPNFIWAFKHGLALSNEYTYRYSKIHKTHAIYLVIQNKYLPLLEESKLLGTEEYMSPFAKAVPNEYKQNNPYISPTIEACLSYRAYYLGAKKDIAKWNKTRPAPDWFTQNNIKLGLL